MNYVTYSKALARLFLKTSFIPCRLGREDITLEIEHKIKNRDGIRRKFAKFVPFGFRIYARAYLVNYYGFSESAQSKSVGKIKNVAIVRGVCTAHVPEYGKRRLLHHHIREHSSLHVPHTVQTRRTMH